MRSQRYVDSLSIRLESGEEIANSIPKGRNGSFSGFSKERLEFGKTCSMGLRSGEYGGR